MNADLKKKSPKKSSAKLKRLTEDPKVKRRTLSCETILREALAVVDSEGMNSLTVRRLAEQLDVTATAIYRHFQNKAEITGGLVEYVVGEYKVTNHQEEDWRDWICTTFCLMHQALCEHPGIITTLGNTSNFGDKAMGVMEQILQKLLSAGFDANKSVQLFHLLMAYTIGTTIITHQNPENSPRNVEKFLNAPQLHFPNLVQLADKITAVVYDEYFRRDLKQIIKSVELL